MREKILTFIEKNSRIDLKELAIILGVDLAALLIIIQKMEEENLLLKRGSFLFAVVFVFQLFGQYSFL